MKLLTGHAGVLSVRQAPEAGLAFSREHKAMEVWTPGRSFVRPAIHELLFDAGKHHPAPAFPAVVLARSAMAATPQGEKEPGMADLGALVWLDPQGTLYPPGVAAAGVSLDRLYILRPRQKDLIEAAVECLRCKSVAAVVTTLPPRPSRVQVRRLQLAAERGGSVGIFLRTTGKASADIYAASSRWLISPARGEHAIQRWNIRLIHGHGGRIGETFLLEKRRDASQADPVSLPAALADHPPLPKAAGA